MIDYISAIVVHSATLSGRPLCERTYASPDIRTIWLVFSVIRSYLNHKIVFNMLAILIFKSCVYLQVNFGFIGPIPFYIRGCTHAAMRA